MKFAIYSLSTDDSVKAVLAPIAAAIQDQLLNDLSPEWGGDHDVAAVDNAASLPVGYIECIVFDHSDQQGALGYHSRTPAGAPYLRVFWEDILSDGGTLTSGNISLSCCLSHEICETTVDPPANRYADRGDGKEEALEACDRVEDRSYAKSVPGYGPTIAVSNFLRQAAFDPGASAPYDFLGELSFFDQTADEGYCILRISGAVVTSDDRVHIENDKHLGWNKRKFNQKFAPGGRTLARGVNPFPRDKRATLTTEG